MTGTIQTDNQRTLLNAIFESGNIDAQLAPTTWTIFKKHIPAKFLDNYIF